MIDKNKLDESMSNRRIFLRRFVAGFKVVFTYHFLLVVPSESKARDTQNINLNKSPLTKGYLPILLSNDKRAKAQTIELTAKCTEPCSGNVYQC